MIDNKVYLGIDGGATKILAQAAIYDAKNRTLMPLGSNSEFIYNPNNTNYVYTNLEDQLKQLNKNIKLTKDEKLQENSVANIIAKIIISYVKKEKRLAGVSLCFPGLKALDKSGITVMKNGPRMPNLIKKIKAELLNNNINETILNQNLLNDSDCSVMGELKTELGLINKQKNIIFIGGGTGLAEGILINNRLINFNENADLKRSWEIRLPTGKTVEDSLSLNGMISAWNNTQNIKVMSIEEILIFANKGNKDARILINEMINALIHLIKTRITHFQSIYVYFEEIIIAHRLGQIFNNKKNSYLLKKLAEKYDYSIPLKYSINREIAALGAIWGNYASR